MEPLPNAKGQGAAIALQPTKEEEEKKQGAQQWHCSQRKKKKKKKKKRRNKVETGRGSRVVNRSNNNANANGGVAYVNSNNAPSNTNANIGPDTAVRDAAQSCSLSSLTRPSGSPAGEPQVAVKEVENHDALGHSGE